MIGIPSKRKVSKKPWVIWLFPVVVVFAVVLGGVQFAKQHFGQPEVPTAQVPEVTYDQIKPREELQAPPTPIAEPPVEEPTNTTTTIAGSLNLAVPFTSQAPFGVWDVVHEDTCEEAAIYMIAEYYSGVSGQLDPTSTDAVLIDMVNRQTELGMGYSISAAQLVSFVDDYYGGAYRAVIVSNPTVDDIKQAIDLGHPVIVPAAGRELGNPFFTNDGPLYHMFVIRGYEDGKFITNDPGTRHGENYTYSTEVVMNAIADWNGSGLDRASKPVIILTPYVMSQRNLL